ncbi:MAG TPA: LacI family DNA-binding transcriptional regulator [Rhodanobacteraceae bacterium]|nr:LacI family DNA-binding transcriptional regulator [Rhodanobacteraceae bacterium]
MTATIKDVARAAGVSVASVSRALNGHESVTEETRARIIKAANDLRYVPHAAARSLITRRTDTVGVVLPDLHGEFFSELIRGMDTAARASGRHLLISSSHGSASEAAQALLTLQGRVDGLLVMSPHADTRMLAANLPQALPIVLMNTRIASGSYAALSVDNYGGAAAMMRYLIDCGYSRIAFIGGPAQNFDADERLRGYRETLSSERGAVETILPGDFGEASGYRAGLDLLAHSERPDAIFAANDMMALGCLFALTEHGLRVPDDIALAGFDDVPIARFASPPLTTVRVRIADLGRRAFERLVARIDGDPDEARINEQLACELVVRQSTGKSTRASAGDTS